MVGQLNGNPKEHRTTVFSQSVNFFHDVNFGDYGKIQVKGKIPHFHPKYSRKSWDSMSKDLEKLTVESIDWARQVMQIDDEKCDIKKVAMTSTIFAVSCNPQLEPFSSEMQQIIRLIVWFWVFDEYIDVTSSTEIIYEDMRQASIILVDIFKGKYDYNFLNIQDKPILLSAQIPKFESIPIVSQLVDGLIDIRKGCLEIFPDLNRRSQGIVRGLEQCLHSVEWNCLTTMDKSYSLDMFRRFRCADSAGELSIEFFALHQGVVIPIEIRSHLIFQKYVDMASDIVAFTNDVLGMTKDSNTHETISNGDRDSTVVFQILEKNIKPEIAVAQSVDDIKERLEDLMQLKLALLTAFPDQPDVEAYIDISESTIDGHFRIYSHSPRYSMNKNVTITDN